MTGRRFAAEMQQCTDSQGKTAARRHGGRRRLFAATWSANGILSQITTTSQDASFNGVNLLGGDQLKLRFNETGKSTLSITGGVTFNAAGLGLANPARGTDFIDNAATNEVVANLSAASTLLRVRKLPPWVRTCRSCRFVRTSPRT
jgi:hypothetical protein